MRRRNRLGPILPLVYLGVALLLVAIALPTVLRPPPDQTQNSAELSPDAPPEDEPETIIQSLRQAASRTAGATGQNAVGTGPPEQVTTTTTILKPSRGRCFGDPPRQTESPYSPPCRAAFTGDNGGKTYTNVSGEQVTIAFWHALGMPVERGPIEEVPPPGESAEHRTARVIQRYFNDRYELYGRRVQLFAIQDNGDPEAEQRASAVRVATEAKAFAAVHLSDPFCGEMTRRGLICFSGNAATESIYRRHDPYWWSYQQSVDRIDQMYVEYICKKLVGHNADFAAGMQKGKPRSIALLVESVPNNSFRSHKTITGPVKQMCGANILGIDFDAREPNQTATAMAQVKTKGITTVVFITNIIALGQMFLDAEASQYFPEWVALNSYGTDFNDAARLLPQSQLPQYFGMSGWELPRPFADTDCYRAYKSVDASNEPDQNWCRLLWISIEHIVNGIQEAGPELTPKSFEKGLYSMPLREARAPWAIGGGYEPGDHSFVDDLAEIWWDPTARDVDGGEPGAFRHTQGGRRFGIGELDNTIRVFKEGVLGYQGGAVTQ